MALIPPALSCAQMHLKYNRIYHHVPEAAKTSAQNDYLSNYEGLWIGVVIVLLLVLVSGCCTGRHTRKAITGRDCCTGCIC